MDGTGLDACPHCRASFHLDTVVTCGPYVHHHRNGLTIRGEVAPFAMSMQDVVGVLMRAEGEVVPATTVLTTFRNGEPFEASHAGQRQYASVVMANVGKALARLGETRPYASMFGRGYAWIHPMGIATRRARQRICQRCGYDLEPPRAIVDGDFSHDPATGRISIGATRMRGGRRLHAMIATLMLADGDVVPFGALSDRMSGSHEDASNNVKSAVAVARAILRRHGTDLPVRVVYGRGLAWTGDVAERRPRYHGPVIGGPAAIGRRPQPPIHDLDPAPRAPTIESDGWIWNPEERSLRRGAAAIGGTAAAVVARIMANAGRCVHADDLADMLRSVDRARAMKLLNVHVHQAREIAEAAGETLPIMGVYRLGYRWEGPAPTTGSVAPERPDAPPLPSARLWGLTPTEWAIARTLGAANGIAPMDEILALNGTTINSVRVLVSRIRASFARRGEPDPIRSVSGTGYLWVGPSMDGTDPVMHGPTPLRRVDPRDRVRRTERRTKVGAGDDPSHLAWC